MTDRRTALSERGQSIAEVAEVSEALAELRRNAGSQFDEQVVERIAQRLDERRAEARP